MVHGTHHFPVPLMTSIIFAAKVHNEARELIPFLLSYLDYKGSDVRPMAVDALVSLVKHGAYRLYTFTNALNCVRSRSA